MNAGAQTGMEFIFIVGFMLAVLSGIFLYSISTYNTTIQMEKAQSFVDNLAEAADQIGALGPGNTTFVTVELPSNVSMARADGNVVEVILSNPLGQTDVWAVSKMQLSTATGGDFTTREGKRKVKVEMAGSSILFTEEVPGG